MSLQTFRTAPDAPDFDEAAGLTYDQAPDYGQEAIDPDYDLADPDYEEDSQGEFPDDFTEPDYEYAG